MPSLARSASSVILRARAPPSTSAVSRTSRICSAVQSLSVVVARARQPRTRPPPSSGTATPACRPPVAMASLSRSASSGRSAIRAKATVLSSRRRCAAQGKSQRLMVESVTPGSGPGQAEATSRDRPPGKKRRRAAWSAATSTASRWSQVANGTSIWSLARWTNAPVRRERYSSKRSRSSSVSWIRLRSAMSAVRKSKGRPAMSRKTWRARTLSSAVRGENGWYPRVAAPMAPPATSNRARLEPAAPKRTAAQSKRGRKTTSDVWGTPGSSHGHLPGPTNTAAAGSRNEAPRARASSRRAQDQSCATRGPRLTTITRAGTRVREARALDTKRAYQTGP